MWFFNWLKKKTDAKIAAEEKKTVASPAYQPILTSMANSGRDYGYETDPNPPPVQSPPRKTYSQETMEREYSGSNSLLDDVVEVAETVVVAEAVGDLLSGVFGGGSSDSGSSGGDWSGGGGDFAGGGASDSF